MASATQLFAVRRKLVELLSARAGLADVQVVYGWPGADKAQRQMIYTDASAQGEQTPAGLKSGRTHYNERAKLDVTVRVEAVGGNQETADTSCESLAAELAECVADNRTLGGVVNWIRADSWVNGSAFNDAGYLAILTYTFEYDARLT